MGRQRTPTTDHLLFPSLVSDIQADVVNFFSTMYLVYYIADAYCARRILTDVTAVVCVTHLPAVHTSNLEQQRPATTLTPATLQPNALHPIAPYMQKK